jgi:hypothetical protein
VGLDATLVQELHSIILARRGGNETAGALGNDRIASGSRQCPFGQTRVPFRAQSLAAAPAPTAFADNNGQIPPNYHGPLFKLSHDYPNSVAPLPPELPWRKAIGGGPITVENASAYVNALKDYVASDMRLMLTDSPKWNAAALKWYNEPWTGYIREATHGLYVGSSPFPADLFSGSGLTKPFTTYVLTFYDKRAANALYNVWGKTAETPAIKPGTPQFAEGAIVVKAAFTTANTDVWPVMENALQWQPFISTNATLGRTDKDKPELDRVSFFQFDIIVKDTKSAPQTGWVFSTLVYDKNATGTDFWDKMVPLGAMWGNDPQMTGDPSPSQPLTQNWINPGAPAYSKMTLGWGGRLSGPNDGAVNDAVIDAEVPKVAPKLPSSSCLSCHSVAEWPMKSFLLPTATQPQQFDPPGFVNSDYMNFWPPGSSGQNGTAQWMHWFQSRPGTVAADDGTVAFDYDMVFVFKSLPAWTQGGPKTATSAAARAFVPEVSGKNGNYNGRPFMGK